MLAWLEYFTLKRRGNVLVTQASPPPSSLGLNPPNKVACFEPVRDGDASDPCAAIPGKCWALALALAARFL